jgi:Zn-dependent protease/CBS domain-containing protein
MSKVLPGGTPSKSTCLKGLLGHRAKMKWSYRVATIAGIQVRIHLTFLLLLAFYAWICYRDGGPQAGVAGVIFILLIFLCVVLHEFGHALAARTFGIRTPNITLLPIGGVARLERMPANPRQELAIAIAGPAVNVLIAIAIFAVIGGVIPVREFGLMDTASGTLLAQLLGINLMLVVFNMIPAFPMDGGRVLRALLATRMRYLVATRIAARIGQVIAVLFGLVSLASLDIRILGFSFSGPMLGFIAIFVFLGAQQELAYAKFRESAQNLRVGQAMITRFQALPISLRAGEIAKTLSESNQGIFPFVDEQLHFHGIASRDDLQRASTQLPPEASASSVARTPPTLTPSTGFGDALELMQQTAEPLLPVVNASGQIVGLLGLGNLAELSASRQPALGGYS